MPAPLRNAQYTCARCLRETYRIGAYQQTGISIRRFTNSAPQLRDGKNDEGENVGRDAEKSTENGVKEEPKQDTQNEEKEEGALTRRLRFMSEEALETGGIGAQKAVSEAGFSEDLKAQLEERIASAKFRAEHRNAFTEAELPSHAGRGTRDIATADPWSGEESLHDVSLRMLNDAHKPLKMAGRGRMPGPSVQLPRSIDTGRRARAGAGERLANARDRSGLYSSLKDSEIDEMEREKRFKELKERFTPNARAVPATVSGLGNLANQRIEDAIARGQFKNLPRGKPLERDYNASNPFLDTTEYFMNKMIKKQEIVPPWIEKQQELVSTATKFRARIRNDWRRHAARTIASKGGSLQEQIRKAEAYAKAELIHNPAVKKEEIINTVDESGHVSQISLSGELRIPASSDPGTDEKGPVTAVETVTASIMDPATNPSVDKTPNPSPTSTPPTQTQTMTIPIQSPTPNASSVPPAPHPLRDSDWEKTESAYHNLAISDLNSKTRSYNLQAPDLAKKPYFSLVRELNACYADVAPQLAEYIYDRALNPGKTRSFGSHLAGEGGGGKKGVFENLAGEKVKVRDERVEKRYGLRQFWRDVWGVGKE